MEKFDDSKILQRVAACLPRGMADEICRQNSLRSGLTEIRLRRFGLSELVFGASRVALTSRLRAADMDEILNKMTDSSLFAYKDSIGRGFISLPSGVRVGVVGSARYESGVIVGVSDASSLIVRIPSKPKRIAEVESAFSKAERGLLIFSSPGVGKTTALKALALSLTLGSARKNLAVIDERREFPPELFPSASIDVYYGYERSAGLEMALRTASPEVVIIDEISGKEQAELVSDYLLSGVKLVASAHAGSLRDLKKRPSLKPFWDIEAFDRLLGIKREGQKYKYEQWSIDD